jgi:hypothetical protein
LLECTRCKKEKPATSEFFPLHNKKKNGLDSWCRSCRGSYRSEIRRGNYRAAISDEELKALIATNKNCNICGSSENLVVDHCHSSGVVRGMLCNHCNRGLGHFRDNTEVMLKAIAYLNKFGGK